MSDPDRTGTILGMAIVAVILIGLAFATCVAPCSSLGWMPVKEAPLRCLPGAPQ